MNKTIEYKIQVFKGGEWVSGYPFFTLEDAQREIEKARNLRPELKYRIIRITERVVEE